MAIEEPKNEGGRPLKVQSEEEVADAIKRCRGLLYLAAKDLGVTVRTIHNYLDRWPNLREIVDTQREINLDIGELSLLAAVNKGEPWAVCFFLKTQGKRRGYTEREADLPPLEVLLAALPVNVGAIVRAALAAAIQPGSNTPSDTPRIV